MNWHPIGPHRYRFEEDYLRWQPEGEMTAEHVRSICLVFDGLLARHGYVIYVIDAKRSRPMGYDARRQFSQWFDVNRPRLAALGYGSGAEPRATAVLIVNAARLRGSREVVMHSVAREAEALALVTTERERFKREVASECGAGQKVPEVDTLTR